MTFKIWISASTSNPYKNLEISWPKVPIADHQRHFTKSKIIQNFLIFFIEEYYFKGTFFVIDIFWKIRFLEHFIY